jgi:alpha-N-arabinofuranosidase
MLSALGLIVVACSTSGTGDPSGAGGASAGSATGGNNAAAGATNVAGTAGQPASSGGAPSGGSGSAAGSAGTGSGGISGSAGMTGGGSGGAGGSNVVPPDPTTCTGTASASPANTLAVNIDSAADVIQPGIFGLLMERLGKNWSGGTFVGTTSTIPNTDGMRNDVIAGFKEAGVGMIEWPGGCAAGGYNWANNKNPGNDVGTDRYMKLCGLLGIEPIIAGPGTAAAAANNLAWITYINDSATHPEWAIHHFKIGNEVWGCGGNQDEATYRTNYLANYEQLKAPINGKPLKIVASTGLIGNWTWLDTAVKNLVGKVDGIEIHDYVYHPDDIPNVGFSDNDYYNVVNAANQGQIAPRVDQIIATLDKYDANKTIKIYEDEWGDWLENFAAGDDWLQQGTLMDAISAAESLHVFMQHADRYAMAGLAQGVNVIHSIMLTRSSDAALVKTPTFHVFKMFIPHHSAGAKWAPSTLKSENITGNGKSFPVLSAGSSVDAQGHVNISLVNVDLVNSRTIAITLNGGKSAYGLGGQIITGPAKDSYNDFAQAEKVNIQPLPGSSCSLSGKTLQVTLPAKSIAMLVLTPTP